MLLHYLGKYKTSNFLKMKKKQTNYISIASNFVIHLQILIFLVCKIANLSPYWLQIKFSMSLLFYLLPAALRAAQACRYLMYSRGRFWGFSPCRADTLHWLTWNLAWSSGPYPLRDFHKICRVCTSFQDALGVKIWFRLLKGLWSYGGFKLRGSGFPQIFSAP